MFFLKEKKTYYKYKDFIFELVEEMNKEDIRISEENLDEIIDKIKELIKEKKRWKTFKNNYPAAFFTVKEERQLIEWNKHFEELTGWSYYDLENVKNKKGITAKILWSKNPAECRVCKVVKQYDQTSRKETWIWRC